jgi:2-succinyl-5-enolpyruvyl-6-hydroxy-3-cyclohexene-1-carboxylate synthase
VLPDEAIVWVASSMPIRHVESFFPASAKPIRFLANRGANGIDGTVAAAAGAALATGAPTFVLIGDVALAHDAGGLLAAARAEAGLGILCVNNGGGGIFDYLPVAEHGAGAAYEEHVATAGQADIGALARLGGLEHVVAGDAAAAAEGVASGTLVELPTDRAASVAGLRAIAESVAAQLVR